MKTKHLLLILLLTCVAILLFSEPAYAAPGGAIAKGLFKSFWGKVLLAALVLIFLPLILYIRLREFFEVRKNKKILEKMAIKNKDFQWPEVQKNVKNIYQRVHVAWDKEQMDEVSEHVTSWYWQNQQLVFLDEWNRKGLKNVCNIKSLGKIQPLQLTLSEESDFHGSKIAFSISADMEDYLMDKETKEITDGKSGYENIEKIWVMEYTPEGWKLDDIHEGSLSLTFARMANIVPETVKSQLGMA